MFESNICVPNGLNHLSLQKYWRMEFHLELILSGLSAMVVLGSMIYSFFKRNQNFLKCSLHT